MASVSGTRGFSAMRLSILGSNGRRSGAGAQSSSWRSRLGLQLRCDAVSYGSDGMFTGARPTTSARSSPPTRPYPGDIAAPAAAVDGSHTGSVSPPGGRPVDLPPSAVSHGTGAGRRQTVRAALGAAAGAKTRRRMSTATTTGTVARRAKPITRPQADPAGWSTAGGTQVTGQGRRDDLQSVAPLRRAGRRA